MKTLVVKHFNQLHELYDLGEFTLDHADLLLICYSACSDKKYEEYKDKYNNEWNVDRFENNVEWTRREFIDFANVDQIICEKGRDYDLVIKLDSAEMSLKHGYVETVIKAMDNDEIGSCYCDFNLRRGKELESHIDIYTPHFSVPSPVQSYPLFAVKTKTFNGTTNNLIGDLINQTRTRHILDVLVTMYE